MNFKPLRTLSKGLERRPLGQRLLAAIAVPLIIGFVLLIGLGRSQLRDSELRLVASEQNHVLETASSQIQVFMKNVPEAALNLANSTSVHQLLETNMQIAETHDFLKLVELQQLRETDLANLTREMYDLVRRSDFIQQVNIFDVDGYEMARVDFMGPDEVPYIALSEVAGLRQDSIAEELSDHMDHPVHISGIEMSNGEQPINILRIAAPLVHNSEPAGGISINVRAEAFLQYVFNPEPHETEENDRAVLLLDVNDFILADTRLGDMSTLPTDKRVLIYTQDSSLQRATVEDVRGAELKNDIVSSLHFNPFPFQSNHSPWTLIVLQSRAEALARVGRFSLAFVLLSMLVMAGLVAAVWVIGHALTRPLNEAAAIADRVAGGDLNAQIPVRGENELSRLAHAINSMTRRLLVNITTLEGQYQERTRDLEVAAEIASVAVGVGNVNTLLNRAIGLIRERFNFHHVQVFLLDDTHTRAELAASTGEAGQRMLQEKWELEVGSDSVIGKVTGTGQTIISLDTGTADVFHRPNPHLPDTRSEMALPMKYGNTLIGALDIQSNEPDAFDQEDVQIFEVLANQLAIAINNALLLDETRRQVRRVEELNRRLTRTAWSEFLKEEAGTTQSHFGATDELAATASPTLSTPIRVRGEVIGTLNTAPPDGEEFGEDEVALIQAVAERVSLAVENARLVTETQSSLAETERLYQASRAIRDVTSIDEALAVFQSLLMSYSPAQIDVYFQQPDGKAHIHHWDKRMPITKMEHGVIDMSSAPFDVDDVLNRPALYADDVKHLDMEMQALFQSSPGVRAVSSVPMHLRNRSVGRLTMTFAENRSFAKVDRDYLASLCDQIAIVLDNWELLQRTQESLNETQILFETSGAIADVNDAEGILKALVEHAAPPSMTHAQLILLNGPSWDTEGATIEIAATWSREPSPDIRGMKFLRKQYPGWRELATKTLMAIDNIDHDLRVSEASRQNYMAANIHALVIVPLETASAPLGAIIFGSAQPREHSARELRIYQSLAEMASISLENALLFDQTEQRARQLQTSAEVSRAVTSILDIGDLLPRVVQLISENFGYNHVQIFLLNNAETHAVLEASTGEAGQTMLKMNWSLAIGSDSVIGKVTELGKPIIALDTSDAAVAHRPNPYLPDTRSEMAVPLATRGRVSGALDVQSNLPNAFSDEDVAVLTSLADQIAVALDNAHLFEETQNYTIALSQQVHNLQRLLEAGQQFTTMLDADEILQTATEYLVDLMDVDHVGIVIAANPGDKFGTLRAEYPDTGSKGVPIELAGAWWREEYLKIKMPIVVPEIATSDALDEGTRQALLGLNIKELVLVPFLLSGEHMIGSIGLDLYESGRVFATEELTLLQLFVTQVSSAYQNAQLFTQTQRQAEEMSFLFNVTATATAYTDMEGSMDSVIELIHETIPSDAVAVFLAESQQAFLESVSSWCREPLYAVPDRIALNSLFLRDLLDNQHPLLVNDLQAETQDDINTRTLRSMVAAPLMTGNQVTGMLALFRDEPQAYNKGHVQLLQALSGSLSAVVQNIQLLDEVRAANDRLRELDKIKSQFLANMSHELRTPLNSIIGFSRVMLKGIDGPLSDMQEQDLGTIYSSGQHLLKLINDILDQAKIEAEKLTLSKSWFDMTSVIDVAKSMSIGLLKDKTVRLNVEIEPDLSQVWGDEMRTRQVMLNLLSNAAKFTTEGSITISAFKVALEDGPYVQISVSDTGIGIPEHKMGSVFVAFEQVDGSLTRTSGGTGLGLPISKSLIELQGGEIWLESTLDVGSTFSFNLPAFEKITEQDQVKDEPSLGLLSSEAQVPLEEQDKAPRSIVMAIDAEVGMHQLYRRYLSKAGYTLEATSNPMQAEELVRVIKPDVILLDVRMPNRDGWEVLYNLKTDEATRHIPIVLCSVEPDLERGVAMGAMAYLAKPFMEETLLESLAQVEAAQAALLDDDIVEDVPAAILEDVLFDDFEDLPAEITDEPLTEDEGHLPSEASHDLLLDSVATEPDHDVEFVASEDVMQDVGSLLVDDDAEEDFASLFEQDTEPVLEGPSEQEIEHKQILIIDDKPETARLISEILKAEPRYIVLTANSGQEGLDMVALQKPDLILLDLHMPEMNGVEVLRKIRGNVATQRIPVVLMTADDDLLNQLHRKMNGTVSAYSKNSLEDDQLLDSVHSILSNHTQNGK